MPKIGNTNCKLGGLTVLLYQSILLGNFIRDFKT